MTDERRVHEVLVKARNLIADGWCQHRLTKRAGLLRRERLYCTAGALAASGAPLAVAERCLVHIGSANPDMVGCVVGEWNDAPGRTKAEVLAAFDRAIAQTAPEPDTSFLSNPEQSPSLAEEVVAP